MLIEAFSAGKDPDRPEANEDRFVVLPGRAYAVIDGVTDRLGIAFDGRSGGRIAAETIQAELEADCTGAPAALLARLGAAIRAQYRRHGLGRRWREEPNVRFGATLALFRHREGFDEVLLVGDSGVRLDGRHVLQPTKALDAITAELRAQAWAVLRERCDLAQCHRLGRQVAFHGAGQGGVQGVLTGAELVAIGERAVAASAARFPSVPRGLIAALVRGGIVDGQHVHSNNARSVLGYSCLDGSAVPRSLVTVARVAAHQVELFTDGYFAHGAGFGVASWEAAADAVEREDPARVGRYACVKGSLGRVRADDRTYLGARLQFSASSRTPSVANLSAELT